MSNIKFSELPNLGNITAATIIPVVDTGVNYTVTSANLQTYVTSTTGNVTGGNILTGGLISATGNISGSYLFGNGSQLTGLPATYGDANVAAYLPTFTGNLTANNISATGAITATANITMGNGIVGGNVLVVGLVSATGNVTGNYFIGNGSQLTSITGASVTGTVANATYATSAGTATTSTTVTGAAQANITSVGTLTSLSATGNISGSYFLGNGSALTGIVANTTYNDANVAAFLPTYTGNMIAMTGNVTTTANVQGAYVKGNGSVLTGLVTSIVAGTGISVSAATGAVTVTATGGGGGTSISNGTSNVSIPASAGNINFTVGTSVNQLVINSLQSEFVGITANTAIQAKKFWITGGGSVGSGLSQLVGGLEITGGNLSVVGTFIATGVLQTGTLFQGPATTKTAGATGTTGQICWDANYIYVCTSSNLWKRVALVSF